jgi:hypothetical protein
MGKMTPSAAKNAIRRALLGIIDLLLRCPGANRITFEIGHATIGNPLVPFREGAGGLQANLGSPAYSTGGPTCRC